LYLSTGIGDARIRGMVGEMKSQSVRSQRSFQEHMKTLYQNIDTLVYAAELACRNDNPCVCNTNCPMRMEGSDGERYNCKIGELRNIIGEHFIQSDIESVELSVG
jgi:predicted ArsR family transcriptional regulator